MYLQAKACRLREFCRLYKKGPKPPIAPHQVSLAVASDRSSMVSGPNSKQPAAEGWSR